MLAEQTSLMVELIKSNDVFNEQLTHSEKAKIWRNISLQCNSIEGVQQKSVEQYKRHWYDLKMKVKNKVKRLHEYYSAGYQDIPEHMQLTEEELYVASFVRSMGGMRDIVDEALRRRFNTTALPRTREQTALLLKLVFANKEHFQKRSMPERKRIWQEIAETLNNMPGAKKNVSGWKKAFWTWRLQAGDNYEKELQQWAQKVSATPKNTFNTGDEANLTIERFKSKSHNYVDSDGDGAILIDYDDLSAEQEDRFYELFMEHRTLLRSGGSDEPLQKQIWANIANELNGLPGITLTPDEWRKKRNWGKLLANVRRHRSNSFNSTCHITNKTRSEDDDICSDPDEVNKVEFEILDTISDDCKWQNSHIKSENDAIDDSQNLIYEGNDEDTEQLLEPEACNSDQDFLCPEEENTVQEQQQHNRSEKKSRRLSTSSTECGDDDSIEYKPNIKRIKFTPPLAKSFRFSKRIVSAVESLTIDVAGIKDVLQTTSDSLASIEEILERQSEKQDETNELLKQNNQLLKMLIEYKKRKRTHKNQ